MTDHQLNQLAMSVAQQSFVATHNTARRASPEKARRDSIRVLDDSLRQAAKMDQVPIDCRDGCSYCCYIRVVATPVEVFGLLDYLQANCGQTELQAFTAKVTTAAQTISTMSAAEHMRTNVECPALEKGRCTAYAARPLRCRAHHSVSAQACKAEYDKPEMIMGPITWLPVRKCTGEAHIQGFDAGLAQAGFDGNRYELIAALHAALTTPSARQDFLKGRQAFPSVAIEG